MDNLKDVAKTNRREAHRLDVVASRDGTNFRSPNSQERAKRHLLDVKDAEDAILQNVRYGRPTEPPAVTSLGSPTNSVAAEAAIQKRQIEVSNLLSPSAMSEMTDYTHLVSLASLPPSSVKIRRTIGDAAAVATTASTVTTVTTASTGIGPGRASDANSAIARYRQRKAAEERDEELQLRTTRTSGNTILADVLTTEQHYGHQIGRLQLNALVAMKKSPAEIMEHVDKIAANVVEGKDGKLATIEEAQGMNDQAIDMIRKCYGEDAVDESVKAMARIEALMATSTQKIINRRIDSAEKSINANTNAGFEKTRKGQGGILAATQLPSVDSERRDTRIYNLAKAILLLSGFSSEAVELLEQGATEENLERAIAMRDEVMRNTGSGLVPTVVPSHMAGSSLSALPPSAPTSSTNPRLRVGVSLQSTGSPSSVPHSSNGPRSSSQGSGLRLDRGDVTAAAVGTGASGAGNCQRPCGGKR
mmetsp:Transcript_25309/g.73249  ORF Transcript_25309/g.73249 Transcript_25309/m.73249 type:complete len:475 (-) Transcript_25309:499-1923(-)